MKQVVHLIAAVIATLCIAVFFISSIAIELTGDTAMIAALKSQIVMPGLFILVPAIACTGATGMAMSSKSSTGLIAAKRKRMPLIGANGLLILLPSAILLSQWASAGKFDVAFYSLQLLELLAGSVNLALMYLNIRDARALTKKSPEPSIEVQ